MDAARQAYKMAGVTPKDIDFAEVHDCFTIAEIIDIEDLGFFPKGKAVHAVRDGATRLNGESGKSVRGFEIKRASNRCNRCQDKWSRYLSSSQAKPEDVQFQIQRLPSLTTLGPLALRAVHIFKKVDRK